MNCVTSKKEKKARCKKTRVVCLPFFPPLAETALIKERVTEDNGVVHTVHHVSLLLEEEAD